VRARIIDKDDGFTEYSTFVTVNNVAPTATLTNDGPINEGASATITFSSPSDPSSADTAAGFHYAYSCSNGSLAGATYAGSGTSASTNCPFDDNGSYTVRARIVDKDGGFSEYQTTVSVLNVAPTATLSNNGPVNEGSPATISFSSQSDPSSADTVAGFHYAYDCLGGSLAGATYAGSGTSASTSCTFNDNSIHTVRARIIDKDGGFSEYTTNVQVNNVAPTATLASNGPVNEGSPATITFSSQSDPSSVDTAAGFHYAYSCSNGSLAGATYAGSGTSASTSCTFNDNGTYVVRARITDKDDGYTEYTTTIIVNNVAPTATLSNNGPVNEGSAATISFSSPSDPSSADTAAGFHYAYDCSNGSLAGANYGNSGSSASTSCTFNDNGSLVVRARIIDKDGGFSEYQTTVTVNNVAPTATLSNDGPLNEGSAATISFSNQLDPSSIDTSAGFHYAYDCSGGSLAGATYAGSGTAASTQCTFPDNVPSPRSVKARIIDKDGGYTEYTTLVVVNNVPPTITAFSGTSTGLFGPLVFAPTTFNGTFKDPGKVDNPWIATWKWDGVADGAATQTYGANTTDTHSFTQNHTYTSASCNHAATVKITDKDGGSDEKTISGIGVGTGGFLPPMTNQPVTNKLRNKQVLPVKIQITSCSGGGVNNLSPAIRLGAGDQTATPDDAVVAIDIPSSVSNADTTGVMRSSGNDGSYIYNMNVDIPLNTDYTVVIYPYGNGAAVGPTLRHVITATK
jgi:hypothetical protein